MAAAWEHGITSSPTMKSKWPWSGHQRMDAGANRRRCIASPSRLEVCQGARAPGGHVSASQTPEGPSIGAARPLRLLLAHGDLAEEPVGFVVNPCREKQLVMLPGRAIIAEAQAPQTIDCDALPLTLGEGTLEGTCVGIEGIDLAIAEITHDERVAKPAEVTRGQGQSPGRVEGSARDQLP